MLLPASPFDLWQFFWRVPPHTKGLASPFATLFAFTDTEGDPGLPDTLAQAYRRGKPPSRKHIDRLMRLIAHRSEFPPEALAIMAMAKTSEVGGRSLSDITWPHAIDGLTVGLSLPSPLPAPFQDILDEVRRYAVLADEFREAARDQGFQRCRELINTAPLAGTATADLVLNQLDRANDPGTAIHVMGLLLPLTLIDLIARTAPHHVGDILEFGPALDQDGRVIRPMRRMMDRLHTETGFVRQEDTFRALFWTHGPLDEIDEDDGRWPTLRDRGWSYRAISRVDRDVPKWKVFGRMIDTVSDHCPGRVAAFERLRNEFWQVCLYENLLWFCEDLATRVPAIDPLIVFRDIDMLKTRHDVTAARVGPQSS